MLSDCFCEECGCVLKSLQGKQELIEAHELTIVELRRRLTRLQNLENERLAASVHAGTAEGVWRYWREKLAPKARKFGKEQQAAVIGCLDAGWTPEDLKQAIDGAVQKPYVGDKGRASLGLRSNRHIGLELICADDTHLMRFMDYAVEAGFTDTRETQLSIEDDGLSRELGTYQKALDNETVLRRLNELRGWTEAAIIRTGVGLDGDRVVFPSYDAREALLGLVRYQPNPGTRVGPKSVAEGSRELFPRPELYDGGSVYLTEGEADALALISIGLQAVSVPGVATWKAGWPHRFERFDDVIIVFDCDVMGRDAAMARERSLGTIVPTKIVDIDPTKTDGWDITDLVMSDPDAKVRLEGLAHGDVIPFRRPEPTRPGIDAVLDALSLRECRVIGSSPKWNCQCPAHDDRHASMVLSIGNNGAPVFHCHAGCTPELIVQSLGLDWPQVFAS